MLAQYIYDSCQFTSVSDIQALRRSLSCHQNSNNAHECKQGKRFESLEIHNTHTHTRTHRHTHQQRKTRQFKHIHRLCCSFTRIYSFAFECIERGRVQMGKACASSGVVCL